MAKDRQLAIRIDGALLDIFRDKCSSNGISQAAAIEALIHLYIDGKIGLKRPTEIEAYIIK